MACDPFQVLLPELWGHIRSYLSTNIDARDRLRLQRTCRAAYKLDPGRILAPGWMHLFEITKSESLITAWNKALQEIISTQLLDRRWFVTPHIFDEEWYPQSESTEDSSSELVIRFQWTCDGMLTIRLTYDTGEEKPWQLSVYYHAQFSSEFKLRSQRLDELLLMAPTLGFGVCMEKIRAWLTDDDFAVLFVKSRYKHLVE